MRPYFRIRILSGSVSQAKTRLCRLTLDVDNSRNNHGNRAANADSDNVSVLLNQRISGGSDDCNSNGIPDGQDIAAGTSRDCDAGGVPDECEPPLNVVDFVDVLLGTGTNSIFRCLADTNQDGANDGDDIAAYIRLLLER